MNRSQRLALIADALRAHEIPDQEELRRFLTGRRIDVSQSSLSRDLKVLGAQRVRQSNGSYVYGLPENQPAANTVDQFRRRFANSARGVRRSGFIVMVFTPPGEAQLVGRLLDAASLAGLSGTVAGDDTVVCIACNTKAAASLERKLKSMLI